MFSNQSGSYAGQMDNGFVLALDVGTRRIGIALASLVARLPAPYGFIDRQVVTDVFGHIKNLIEKEQVSVVVVGLPRDMTGQETDQTRLCRDFAAELAQKITQPVVMQDEAVTSHEAEARLRARGKAYGKGDIDAEAAAMILDDYLKLAAGRTA